MSDPTNNFIGGIKVSPDGGMNVNMHGWDEDSLDWSPVTLGTPVGPAANVAVTNFPDVQNVRLVPGEALTAESPDSAAVDTSSAEVVAANASRMGLVLLNLSSNTISLGLGVAAELNKGITLTPFGSWVMDENTMFNGVINAIASAGSSTLSIQEFSE